MTSGRRAPAIRPVQSDDRVAWGELWRGYLRFYRARLDPSVTEATWSRLIDPGAQPHGLVAELDCRLVGLAHYLFHPSTWSATGCCYLEDLFTLPEARGQGVARALIEAVCTAAEATGATRVYWHTQEFNAEGRALYDTLARRTSFIVYER
jgi:GNAT superfamily N-acetyltransferase